VRRTAVFPGNYFKEITVKTQIALAVLTLLAAHGVYAEPARQAPQPTDMQPYYALLGNWHGTAKLVQAGQAAIPLQAEYSCQKASEGWAVSCSFNATGANDMVMSETDLFGVDPASKQGHWYAVTNMGEVHDHLASWTDSKTMVADYEWTEEGKTMHEHISFIFKSAKSMEFTTQVTADKQVAAEFNGYFDR
jgi:hypothetical protein